MTTLSINEQIALARQGAAAAAAQPDQGASAGGLATTPGSAAPAVAAGGRPVTLSEVLSQGGLRVDAYMKVDKTGFMIGTDIKNTFEEILVEFKLSDVVPFWGLRYGSSPTKYLKSFDRMVESRTKRPWATVMQEAMTADAKCRGDYPSAEIPFTLLQDLIATKGDKKDQALIKRGQTLGLTLSITNFKDFASFIKPYDDFAAAGRIDPMNTILSGKLVHAARSGGGNDWGAALFEDFAVVDVSAIDAENAASE